MGGARRGVVDRMRLKPALLIVGAGESNAIWTSSSPSPSRRRRQILAQIHATFPAVGGPGGGACPIRLPGGRAGRVDRAPPPTPPPPPPPHLAFTAG